MKIEFINLNKDSIDAYYASNLIILMDQDDFIFRSIKDDHLTRDSQYAKDTGLLRFEQYGSATPPLLPKIKIKGAIAFLLPDGLEYNNIYLSVPGGNIQEV